MKRSIDISKVNKLLKIQRKTKKSLANAIGIKESNLSSALSAESRGIAMDYVIDIAEFFNVDAKSIVSPLFISKIITSC